jgi:hypothetical protein
MYINEAVAEQAVIPNECHQELQISRSRSLHAHKMHQQRFSDGDFSPSFLRFVSSVLTTEKL